MVIDEPGIKDVVNIQCGSQVIEKYVPNLEACCLTGGGINHIIGILQVRIIQK